MRRAILLLSILIAAACGGGGGSDKKDVAADTLVLESASLRNRSDGGCELFGTLFNTSSSNTCDGFVDAKAFNSAGTVLDDSIDEADNIPPKGSATYAVEFFQVSCSSIARTEHDLTQFCGEAFR